MLCPYRIFVFFQITKIRPNLNSSQELVHSSQKLGHSIAVSLPHTCVFPNHKNQTEPQPKHLTLYFKDDPLCKLYLAKICNPISMFLNSEF